MKYLITICLALSIQAKAGDREVIQGLMYLGQEWGQPSYYNNNTYSPPTDSFGPYKQYMQRQQEQYQLQQQQQEIKALQQQLKQLEKEGW